MATEAITQFPVLPAGQVASNDLLPIVDVSDLSSATGTTKQVTTAGLLAQPLPADGRTVTTLADYLANNAVFNVKDFGATGDGTTDDTIAIQSAIATAGLYGGRVYLPIGTYVVSQTLILTGGVCLEGQGSGYGSAVTNASTAMLKYTPATGFCVKVGNTAGVNTYGNSVSNLRIYCPNGGSAIWLYGVIHCSLRNIDVEGTPGTTTTIGVQIDGANISAFFITMEHIQCNHVFKGFVHTTTGTTKPTQVTGINCTALCDNTTGSMGVDVQNIAGVGCGDGVTYLGGNMEVCAIGINLAGSGTTLIGVRFENVQGVASDITFTSTARNNQVIGGATVFTITDASGGSTNQVICVPKNMSTNTSQENKLDSLLVSALGNIRMAPNGTNTRLWGINTDATFAGKVVMQAGPGSAGMGGAINLYGHAHGTHPGDVVAAISSGSGGKFRVNSQGLDGGTDFLVVDPTTGEVTQRCATHLIGSAVALNNGAAAQVGTLANAPAAGNPTKWIPINDNGTTRYIPAW